MRAYQLASWMHGDGKMSVEATLEFLAYTVPGIMVLGGVAVAIGGSFIVEAVKYNIQRGKKWFTVGSLTVRPLLYFILFVLRFFLLLVLDIFKITYYGKSMFRRGLSSEMWILIFLGLSFLL